MDTDKAKNEELHRALTDYLVRTRRRRTPERYMVLDCIAAADAHFSASDIHSALADKGYRLSPVTVYNTIGLLMECGLLVEHNFGNGIRTYEMAPTRHFHLVCTVCGKVKEVSDSALEVFLAERRFASFTPRRFSLSVFGTCSRCARLAKKEKKQQKTTSKDKTDRKSTIKKK